MDYSLEQEIQEILDELPSGLRNNFQRCIEDIATGNYRYLRGSDDALSAVIQADQFCRNCRRTLNGELRNRIDHCILLLIKSC